MRDIPDCPACGAWHCARCPYVRRNAARWTPQHCARCRTDGQPTTEGWWQPTKHYSRAKAEDHLDFWMSEVGIKIRNTMGENNNGENTTNA